VRGPQTSGELKTRTERLHAFAGRDDVDACLRRLADRQDPLVRRLERRPGQQDSRWAHLLGPVAEPAAGGAVEPAVDRERPLAGGAPARDERVRVAYAAVAADYADRLGGELDDLPFERWLLDRVVAMAGSRPVVDAGCGPGHVTAYLRAAGADARGIDLTPEMVEQARVRFPGVRYDVGDLTRLMRPDNADGWGAVLAWYSLIHLADSEFAPAVAALARPLTVGGVLVLAGHAGRDVRRVTSWFGHDVELDGVLHDPAFVVATMTAAGLEDVEWYVRGRLAGREETTDRFYVMGRRPAR
jgi:SAM-dependent methyltransferase